MPTGIWCPRTEAVNPMSHPTKDPGAHTEVPIPEQASLGTDKGSRVLMWISGAGLVALLLAVVLILWQEKPTSQTPGDAVSNPAPGQPNSR